MAVIVVPGYVNHIGSCVDGAGNMFIVATQDGPLPGGVDVDAVIRRRDAVSGAWTDVTRFTQVLYGKHGYGALEVVGNDLVCVLSEEEGGEIVGLERVIYDVAVPLGGGASDGLVRQCLRALRAAVASALAPLG